MNDEIIDKLEAFYLVYNSRSPLVGEALAKFFGQYRDALEGCTVEMLNRVCQIWYDRDSKRFPFPNEMGEMVNSLRHRDDLPKAEAWRQIGREEYAALSLRAKIRYLTILAFEYRKAAGPMFAPKKGDGPVKPEAWAKWTPLAEQCEAECRRLNEQVKGYEDGTEEVYRAPVTRLIESLPFGRSTEYREAY